MIGGVIVALLGRRADENADEALARRAVERSFLDILEHHTREGQVLLESLESDQAVLRESRAPVGGRADDLREQDRRAGQTKDGQVRVLVIRDEERAGIPTRLAARRRLREAETKVPGTRPSRRRKELSLSVLAARPRSLAAFEPPYAAPIASNSTPRSASSRNVDP